jgi:peptidoglycan/LPS O-acetylase OafA/YrhL
MGVADLTDCFKPFYGMFNGVPIFFILSGFLIWKSIERTDKISTFFKKRLFRLYPELWMGVFLSFVVIIILYAQSIEWIPYVLFQITQATFLQFWTPECLRGYGCGTPNGALWTICVMVQAYLVMWFLHKVLHKQKFVFWIIVNIVCIALGFLPSVLNGLLPEIVLKLLRNTFVPYMWLFVLGMTLSEYFIEIMPVIKKCWFVSFGLAAVIALTGWDLRSNYGILLSIFMGIAIVGFAYAVPYFQMKHDISYGLYVYHMIVVNAMIQLGFSGEIWHVLVAFLISIAMATISYFTIGRLGKNKRQELAAQSQ